MGRELCRGGRAPAHRERGATGAPGGGDPWRASGGSTEPWGPTCGRGPPAACGDAATEGGLRGHAGRAVSGPDETRRVDAKERLGEDELDQSIDDATSQVSRLERQHRRAVQAWGAYDWIKHGSGEASLVDCARLCRQAKDLQERRAAAVSKLAMLSEAKEEWSEATA